MDELACICVTCLGSEIVCVCVKSVNYCVVFLRESLFQQICSALTSLTYTVNYPV